MIGLLTASSVTGQLVFMPLLSMLTEVYGWRTAIALPCGLPYSDFTLYGLSVFAVFYGLDWIATVPPTARLIAERFGRERANLVFGWVFAGHQLGVAAAAFGAGLLRTVLQSYLPAFVHRRRPVPGRRAGVRPLSPQMVER